MYLNRKVFLFKRNNSIYYIGAEVDGNQPVRKINQYHIDRFKRPGFEKRRCKKKFVQILTISRI